MNNEDTAIVVGGLLGVLIMVMLFVFTVVIKISPSQSEGERIGVVTKISKKGVFCKSWEGEMLLGYGQNGVMAHEKFYFSTMDNAIGNQISDVARNSGMVVLSYKEPFITWPCTTSTTYHITKVQKGDTK